MVQEDSVAQRQSYLRDQKSLHQHDCNRNIQHPKAKIARYLIRCHVAD